MTYLMKFMRNSVPSVRRAIESSTGGGTRYKNRLESLNFIYKEKHIRYWSTVIRCYGKYESTNNVGNKGPILIAASIAFLGFFEKKEEKDSELITTIKRSILLIQKGEFKKAEQMLHLALRQAQTLHNEDGITYVYDVMANLAFELGEYDKAEKLFKSVMQRVLAAGTPQDDLKMVHMSLKMAKIFEARGDYNNAESGYKYCIKILKNHIDNGTEDLDILKLWAMNCDWYAHLLLTVSRYTEAMKYMENAYVLCVKLNGEVHEQSVVLLNDLGSISFTKGKLDDAIEYLNKALEIGRKLPKFEDLSSIYINLGNVYLKKGLLDEAKRSCTKGWKLSKSKKNYDSLDEAKACLDEVNKLLTK